MKNSRFKIARWAGLFGLIVLVSCATVTETGRQQLNWVSSDQEIQLGLTAFQDMKKQVPISKDAAANALLQKVGKRISAVADLPGAQWEFVVFESKEANAFCLPGGKVGIYTGILPVTRDEAGLATVIGHEVAHAAAHHGGERMTQAGIAQLGGQTFGAALSSADPKTQALWNSLYGVGAQVGVLLPYGRLQESEADHIGLRYMAKAGYDPEASVAFWQRFASYNQEHGGGGTLPFLSTHPDNGQRIEQLKQWMPEAKALYRPQ